MKNFQMLAKLFLQSTYSQKLGVLDDYYHYSEQIALLLEKISNRMQSSFSRDRDPQTQYIINLSVIRGSDSHFSFNLCLALFDLNDTLKTKEHHSLFVTPNLHSIINVAGNDLFTGLLLDELMYDYHDY